MAYDNPCKNCGYNETVHNDSNHDLEPCSQYEPEEILEDCPCCFRRSLIVVGGGHACLECSHSFAYTQ